MNTLLVTYVLVGIVILASLEDTLARLIVAAGSILSLYFLWHIVFLRKAGIIGFRDAYRDAIGAAAGFALMAVAIYFNKIRKPAVCRYERWGLIAIALGEDYQEAIRRTKDLGKITPVIMRVATFSPLGSKETRRQVTGSLNAMKWLLKGCRVKRVKFYIPPYGEAGKIKVLNLEEINELIWKGRRQLPANLE